MSVVATQEDKYSLTKSYDNGAFGPLKSSLEGVYNAKNL